MKHKFAQWKWLLVLGAILIALFVGQPAARVPSAFAQGGAPARKPQVSLMRGKGKVFDLRGLTSPPPVKAEQPEAREPLNHGLLGPEGLPAPIGSGTALIPAAPMPSPSASFDGLDFATWGAGHPPDTNGDVGPTYYIETVNTSFGVYNKSTGVRVAAVTLNNFMSQGSFGNLCDTNNFGDPVVLYDTFEDRWIITDFAFQLDGSGNVINPPGSFQCIAASKSGDPVSGGWNFYSINTTGGLGDYPKFGIWSDGLYMSTNMFGYANTAGFQNARAYAFNKAQMYAGNPTVQVVSFDAPSAEFSLMPANARLETGTPPTGRPNHYAVVWQYTNAISVYDFHVDWNSISTSTFTGPSIAIAPASWASPPNNVPSLGGNAVDTLALRLMMQNQYTNLGGVESLWDSHTVQGTSSAQSAVRYYQVNVTGGTLAANTTQAATWNPDPSNRFMPSAALDRAGDMAFGYSVSSTTLHPAIRYAGRLATDPLNTLPQTETSLIEGTGSQSGNCGPSACIRWGDYSAMTLDPDGCRFWYANEYYAVTGLNDLTRIGSFKFPSCTTVTSGTLQGTVTSSATGNPIGGVTAALGSRTTTTNGSGVYQFTNLPSGTYPNLAVSCPGFVSASTNLVSVTDGATTTQNYALAGASAGGCVTDTTQADFQKGVPTNVDLTTSPGTAVLAIKPDQQNTSVTANGFGFTSASWAGQTWTPVISGPLVRVDLDLFCSGCTGTTPNITVSIRATTGATPVPTGSDLATATIPGFSSGAGGYFTANFATPPTVTAGTRYAVIFRPVSNPSAGIYAYVCSCAGTGTVNSNPYSNGQLVTSGNSGATWAADTTSGGRDLGFKTYVGYNVSGNQVSELLDANPAAGTAAQWSTLSWTATTPANTTIQFQVAGSNHSAGPFTFVGPDGTAATFFTNGGSLAQFNGDRYLKYKAVLSTTNNTVTPTLSDVTLCFNNAVPTSVDLLRFRAQVNALPRVRLKWVTANELNLQGFNLWRATDKDGPYTLINTKLIAAKNPGSVQGATYTHRDKDVAKGNVYFYRVELVASTGSSTWSDPLRVAVK